MAEKEVVETSSDAPCWKWFKGGQINASYNCVDRHLANPKSGNGITKSSARAKRPSRIPEGSPTKAARGWNLQVVDENSQPVATGKIAALVAKLPLPPGTLPTLCNNEQGFLTAYLEEFPGYYKTADAGFIDEAGYVFMMNRTDDIINVAGHCLSTGAMEEVMADHPDMAECAVLGVEDKLKGQVPVGFVVLRL